VFAEVGVDHPGDPGLFGPDSVSWRVHSDLSMLVGGVRSLLVQALHPLAMTGVARHSNFRDDPLGRLARTGAYVGVTTFGAVPEADLWNTFNLGVGLCLVVPADAVAGVLGACSAAGHRAWELGRVEPAPAGAAEGLAGLPY
jgi:hypothetical protein